MEKIYGYREKDIIGLAEFLKGKGNASLSETFERYGVLNGKAKGTVRNLYYALAKKSNEDQEFCQKYLGGKPLSVGKIIEFDGAEEKELIKKILIAKNEGRSVRSAIMELSDGDGKTALRYQNKFRNAIKNKPELIEAVIGEMKKEGKEVLLSQQKVCAEEIISEVQFRRLKSEINGMVSRISSKIRKENEYLKERVGVLERENIRLLSLLYGGEQPTDARKFFKTRSGKEYIN